VNLSLGNVNIYLHMGLSYCI